MGRSEIDNEIRVAMCIEECLSHDTDKQGSCDMCGRRAEAVLSLPSIIALLDKGRFRVKHAGILIRRSFDSREDAEEWAKWNYSSTAVWEIVERPAQQPVN
jgi:hypothetical protein